MTSTMSKLQDLLKSKEQLEAELMAEQQKAARAEKEKVNAEREKKAAQELADRDGVMYNQTTEMVNKILTAIGKKDPSTTDIIAAMYLILTTKDYAGYPSPMTGLGVAASYFRGEALTKKAVKK